MKEGITEKLVMKDFNPNQKNVREDGEIGTVDEESDPHQHGPGQGQGVPCQAQ